MRIGIAKFILPFFFVLSPAMILRGSFRDIFQVVPTAALGLILISGGLEGYFWFIGKINIWAKIFFVLSGLLLGIPETRTDLFGVLIAVMVIAVIFLKKKMARSELKNLETNTATAADRR